MKRSLPVIGLVTFLFLVPLLLFEFMGAPYIPTVNLDEVKETLSGPFLSVDSVIRALGLLTWVLWAYLVVVIVLRSIAVVALQRGSPSGGRLIALTSVLGPAVLLRVVDVAVGAILLMGPITSGKVDALPSPFQTAVVSMKANEISGNGHGAAIQRSYVVRPGDSLWRIAEKELGAGTRWSEIFDLNRGRQFPDGRTLDNPRFIRPNWVLWLPPSAINLTVPRESAPPIQIQSPQTQPPATPVVSSPQTPGPPAESATKEEARKDPGPLVELPSGAALAASFASGVLLSQAIAALKRRRAYVPREGASGGPQLEPDLVVDLRRAQVSSGAEKVACATRELVDFWKARADNVPRIGGVIEEADRVIFLIDEADHPEGSNRIAFSRVGALVRAEVGRPLDPARDRLSALEEGLLVPMGSSRRAVVHAGLLGVGSTAVTGEEAARFAVQSIVACVAGRTPEEVEVYLLGETQAFGPAIRLPHIKSKAGWEDAEQLLQEIQAETMARARAFSGRVARDVRAYLALEEPGPMPAILIVAADPPDAMTGLIDGIGSQCSRYGCALLGVGWQPSSARLTVRVDSQHVEIDSEFSPADRLRTLLGDDNTLEEAVEIIREAFSDGRDKASEEVEGATPGEASGDGPMTPGHGVVAPPVGEQPAGASLPQNGTTQAVKVTDALREIREEAYEDAATVRCLGPMVVLKRGRPIQKGWQSRSKELLAYLIAHREGASKEEIVRLFWPEVGDRERALKLLRTAIFRLRDLFLDKSQKWMETYVLRKDDFLKLEPGRWTVDAWRFESTVVATKVLAAEEAIPLLREATATYQGSFCEDCDFPWVEAVRERYRRLLIEGSARLSDLLESKGDYDEAIRVLEGALIFEPICEDLHRRLIALEAVAGRADEAEKRYQRLVAVLAVELGEEPQAETLGLMRRIRSQERSRPEPARRPL